MPFTVYSFFAMRYANWTGPKGQVFIELLTGSIIPSPRLIRAGGEINARAACSTGVRFVELVRKNLFLCTTVVTLADK
jgi:hypothetical protein